MRYLRKDGSDIITTNQQTPFNGIYKSTIDLLIRISVDIYKVFSPP